MDPTEINLPLSTSTSQLPVTQASRVIIYLSTCISSAIQESKSKFIHLTCILLVQRSHWQYRKGEMKASQVHEKDAETEMEMNFLNRARESNPRFSARGCPIGRWSKATAKTRWASTLVVHLMEMEMDRERSWNSPLWMSEPTTTTYSQ